MKDQLNKVCQNMGGRSAVRARRGRGQPVQEKPRAQDHQAELGQVKQVSPRRDGAGSDPGRNGESQRYRDSLNAADRSPKNR